VKSQETYFSSDQFKNLAHTYSTNLLAKQAQFKDYENLRNNYIAQLLGVMRSQPELWNEHCPFNIETLGKTLINLLEAKTNTYDKDHYDSVFAACYRFFFELYLSMRDKMDPDLMVIRQFALEHLEKFTPFAKTQIEYAYHFMPVDILKLLMNNENIVSIKEFNKSAANAAQMKAEWDKELNEKTSAVIALKDNLDKYNVAFNFVGLYQGFDEMVRDKLTEKNYIRVFLILFGLLTVIPVTSELMYIFFTDKKMNELREIFIVALIPTISLVAILIYYFRIFLFNYKSVKSQILQLELRKALCRFIQDYVNYSTVARQKDKDSLSKFENIIFSGIVSSDDKLPSTFDGVDQIANLIKSIRQN
jgi:hypothetical protein